MAAALRRVRGVTSATADKRQAVVQRDPVVASDQDLVQAVQDVGYGARVLRLERCRIDADMTGDDGIRRVTAAIVKVPGVKSLALVGKRVARVDYDPHRTSEQKLVDVVRSAGFRNARLSSAARAGATPDNARPASTSIR